MFHIRIQLQFQLYQFIQSHAQLEELPLFFKDSQAILHWHILCHQFWNQEQQLNLTFQKQSKDYSQGKLHFLVQTQQVLQQLLLVHQELLLTLLITTIKFLIGNARQIVWQLEPAILSWCISHKILHLQQSLRTHIKWQFIALLGMEFINVVQLQAFMQLQRSTLLLCSILQLFKIAQFTLKSKQLIQSVSLLRILLRMVILILCSKIKEPTWILQVMLRLIGGPLELLYQQRFLQQILLSPHKQEVIHMWQT